MIEEETKPNMKYEVALYDTEYGVSIVQCGGWVEDAAGYARITERVRIQFTPRPREEVVPEQIAKIENEIQEIQAAAGLKVTDLERKKQELLALTGPKA